MQWLSSLCDLCPQQTVDDVVAVATAAAVAIVTVVTAAAAVVIDVYMQDLMWIEELF